MGAFDYTQKPFWRGAWYPYWSLILVSILGGLFGLDHWYLRSPVSGVLKLIVNVLTFGLWYFYDILQIIGEPDYVKKYGLSAPVWGPLGIGAGMFRESDQNSGGPLAKAPFRYFAYLFLTLLPFGFDYFIAGDTMGAAARFLTSIFFLLWPIGFIWGCVNMFRATFMPEHLFTKGMYRMFPFSLVMDTYGPSKLGPVDIGITDDETDQCGNQPKGLFGTIFSFMFGWIPALATTVLNIVLPGIAPASAAVGAAVQAGATTAKVAADSASAVIQAATAPAAQTVSTVSSIAQKAPAAVAALPSVAGAATAGLAAATTPAGLKALAATQKGGGLMSVDKSNIALFIVFAILLGGGSLLALQRVLNLNTINLLKRREDEQPKESDSPPEPRGIRGNAASSPSNRG